MLRSGSHLLLLLLSGSFATSAAQSLGTPVAASSLSSSSSGSIGGQVVNAITGAPVFRALVQMDSHSQLTDHEGHFSFAATSLANATTLTVFKPGFYATPEGEPNLSVIVPAGATASLSARLYPEGLITGTLTDMDGMPLQDVMVTAERSLYSDSGHQWIPLPPRQSNSRGEFRLAVPAGDYRLQVGMGRRMQSLGNIYIPQIYPSISSAETSSFIHVASGAEEHLNLHAQASPLYPLAIRIEPSGENGFTSITAITDTGARIPVNGNMEPSGFMAELPVGTFTLIASRNRGDQMDFAETRVSMTGTNQAPTTLRLVPLPAIPVIINVDRSNSTSDKAPPTFQQLGITLSAVSGLSSSGRGGNQSFNRDNSTSLRPLPGTYRLLSQGRGSWHIQSATYGSTDLLQNDLTVGLGSGSAPIVITVSDQSGSLSGTASINGVAQSVWVYLIPGFPSATSFYSVRSSPAGAFSFSNIPPGSYQVLAFELHRQIDLHSPSIVAPYSTYIHTVTVGVGEKASLDIEAVPATETRP